MVLPFTVASADGSQYRCLYPSEGIVAESHRLAHGIAGVDSENPVRLVAAVGSKEQAVVATVRLQVSMPLRTDSSVREEIHRRKQGCVQFRY